MIRTVIFMGLMAMSMLIASYSPTNCCSPLTKTTRETLKFFKKEIRRTIILTTKKVNCNDVDAQVGNEIIDSLTKTTKQFDTLIAESIQLEKKGNKEAILRFAERTSLVIMRELISLKSLLDLYDISTYSQFETATFFPADSFSISLVKTDEVKKAIDPVARRIVLFCNDHPRQRFEVVITCSSTPGSQVQNDTLCEERARSVATLLLDQIRSNEEFIPNPELIHYNIKWVPKREVLPYPGRRKHAKLQDVRPNMVSLSWNLVPVSLYAGSSALIR